VIEPYTATQRVDRRISGKVVGADPQYKHRCSDPAKGVYMVEANPYIGVAMQGKKLVISARPSRMTYPTGSCIKELAICMHSAERFDPIAANHIDAAWTSLGSFSHPKSQIPRKVESRKEPEGIRGLEALKKFFLQTERTLINSSQIEIQARCLLHSPSRS
jgi:hypothetical protein